MRAVRLALLGPLVIAGAVSATPASAGATHRVVTANNNYLAPRQTIVVGDSLFHTNVDQEGHDLVSNEFGPDGEPWFDSDLIGPGETAPVPLEGVPAGVYGYTCSIHPFMQGTLDVREPTAPPPDGSGEIEVSSGDSFFSPKTITVPAGTTLRWRNVGGLNHTVTARDGSWDSSPACPQVGGCWTPGQTFSRTFNSVGLFSYYCKLHGTPGGGGHAGTVKVVPPGSLPTVVNSASASAAGSQVSVSGSASFQGEAPITVSQDPPGDGPVVPGFAGETGVDLIAAKVYRPDPAAPVLFFEWHLTGLPPSGSLPEGVRYTLPFKIGTKAFQLQAKLTDLASPTPASDPSGRASRSGNVFELRGDCSATGPVPGSTCSRIAWLNGSFDSLHDVVRVKVPLGAAAEIVAGAVLGRNQSPTTDLVSLQAGYQAIAATAADQADWGPDAGFTYRVPDRRVLLGIAPVGTPESEVAFDANGTVGADGSSFSGSVSAPGPGSWNVWVKACFGANCGTASTSITL